MSNNNLQYAGWSEIKFHAVHDGKQWQTISSQPEISVSAACVQYAQSVIEGMKAYKTNSSEGIVFRVDAHHERFQTSLKKLNFPAIDYEFFNDAVWSVVSIGSQWDWPMMSKILYIRPVVYGLDGEIFPLSSQRCGFSIFTAPVGNFRRESCSIRFFDVLTRTSEKGLSTAKTAMNYAPIISKPKMDKAVVDIWYDPISRQIEEADTANIFFVIGSNTVVTPQINYRILPGITRDSVIEIIRNETSYKVIERNITVDEVLTLSRSGELFDCFMTSTGIGIQQVNEIWFNEEQYVLKSNNLTRGLSEKYHETIFGNNKLYDTWRNVFPISLKR